ncbi:hypothetical protein PYW07_006572 [Mythimna separata]|uniref:Fibroin light chain n=1 Tax=Mythimna separata TaxID=271217 RepID=A0AAD7YTX3_MYTSE|nr:hypothetical protein PYW07_006572 [Mythimna separata]
MLPIVLVLLFATSCLAAPGGAYLNAISINDVVPPKHNGGITSAHWTDQASYINDGGDTSPYAITAFQVVNDLANQGDKSSQALALAQTIGLLGALGTGIPGDACAPAELIDAYVNFSRSGNKYGICSAVRKFVHSLTSSIDTIVTLTTNPKSLRFATGPRGNCNGGGRTYQFEAAWDYILANAPKSSAGLVNEQYCSAKRLYNAFTARSNNVGAYLTAVSLPQINAIFKEALPQAANLVSAITTGNIHPAAAALKKALVQVAQNC